MKKRLLVFLLAGVLSAVAAYLLYRRPVPQYGWLVFGPQAHLRVLICLVGEAITLEPYDEDKPTGRQERFADRFACKDIAFADPDAKTCYVITRTFGPGAKPGEPAEILVNVAIKGRLEYEEYCDLRLGDDPQTAPLAHFHGPLQIGPATIDWKLPPNLALHRGEKPTDLQAVVGTMDARKGCWVVIHSEAFWSRPEERRPAFPKGVQPFADVEFPPRTPGEPPVRRCYPLDQAC